MSSPIAKNFEKKAFQAKRRAKRAKTLYRLAMGAGLVLAAGFLVQSQFGNNKPNQNAVPKQIPKQIGSAKINFAGIDEQSRAFAITAQTAMQDEANASLIHLSQVIGNFAREDGNEIAVSAAKADYDIVTKQLAVSGDVIFEQRDRFQIAMQTASVNLGQQSLSSNDSVRIITPTADIKAGSIVMTQDGKIIKLGGRVFATFETDILKD